MGGQLRAVSLGGIEDVFHHLEEMAALCIAARDLPFAAHATAANEVDAIVSVEARHGVDERQRLDGEAELDELQAQVLEPLELVPQAAGPLELESLAGFHHLLAKRAEWAVVRAVE